MISALEAHDIEFNEDITVDFFDNIGTPLDYRYLFDIVGQKINCGCFYLELKISGESSKRSAYFYF